MSLHLAMMVGFLPHIAVLLDTVRALMCLQN